MKRTVSFLLASALLFTAALVLNSCQSRPSVPLDGVRDGGGAAAGGPVRTTLAQPVYPEFPQQPVMPEEGPAGGWEAYMEAYDRYTDALAAIRGENPGLTERERAALSGFAGRSLPLVLEGREGENVVYSPLSLWSALAMLAQCAGGDSRQQVLDAIGADSLDALQEDVSRIWQSLYTDDGQSALILANSIWLNSALEGNYVQDTLDTLAGKYYAGAYAVPMGTAGADQAVTDWVKEQTHGLIGSDAPVVETKAETLALLASSLYYKAAWEDKFLPELTEEDVFTDAAGQESRVDFMHQTRRDSFLRREGWQAAQLATLNGFVTFVLPDEGVSPESLLRDPDFLSELDFSMENTRFGEVRWSVPKFDVDCDLDLNAALSAMGVIDLLDPDRADLTALTDLDAFLSEARQLARVKVDEEGVEAAAVTILMMDTTAAMPPEDPEVCVMDLDRPFLFVIRTAASNSFGVPLFVGIVNQVQ